MIRSDASDAHRLSLSGRLLKAVNTQVKQNDTKNPANRRFWWRRFPLRRLGRRPVTHHRCMFSSRQVHSSAPFYPDEIFGNSAVKLFPSWTAQQSTCPRPFWVRKQPTPYRGLCSAIGAGRRPSPRRPATRHPPMPGWKAARRCAPRVPARHRPADSGTARGLPH